MPGRIFLAATLGELAEAFAADAGLATGFVPPPEAAAGDRLLAVVANPRRILSVRWGLIPMGRTNARGRPVMDTFVNARSEALFAKSAFANLRRALLPVSGWYEWTGERQNKTRWALRAPDRAVIAFAAVWDVWQAPCGAEAASLATVTCAPNAEVAAVHDRMPVILAAADWSLWLGETDGDPARLLRPVPDGSLSVAASGQ